MLSPKLQRKGSKVLYVKTHRQRVALCSDTHKLVSIVIRATTYSRLLVVIVQALHSFIALHLVWVTATLICEILSAEALLKVLQLTKLGKVKT